VCVAQRCPVCEGAGSVPGPDLYGMGSTVFPPRQTCHGCGGNGWVTVHCFYEPTPLPTVTVTVDGVPVEKAFPGISNAGYPVAHD